jgi:outer membrane protein
LRTDSPADVFGLELMQERFSFPSFVQSDPNQPDPFDNLATEFSASMPLFTGGRIRSGIGQADAMAKAASAGERYTRDAVSFSVVSAYLDALLADSAVALATRARETTARHVDQAQAFYDAGMMVESDLLQAEVQLARMEEGLIRARNNATLAHAGLNRAMGVDQDSSFDLDPDPTILAADSLSLDEAIERASSRRADLLASGLKARVASLGISRARGELLPEVGLLAKYSLNDDHLFGAHGKSYTLMAMARWSLFNGGQSWARLARSRHEAAAAHEAWRSHHAQVELEARQAYQAVAEARARRSVASNAVGAAERALAILEDRFNQGVEKVTDLLDAETMLNEARLRDLQARFDLGRAVRALDFTTGSSPVPEVAQ